MVHRDDSQAKNSLNKKIKAYHIGIMRDSTKGCHIPAEPGKHIEGARVLTRSRRPFESFCLFFDFDYV